MHAAAKWNVPADAIHRPGKVPGPGVQFTLVNGRLLPDGAYQRPMVALVCNFPPPQQGRETPLSVTAVQTLFHEFGHVSWRCLFAPTTACVLSAMPAAG
jgi:Zn-dependent oligopeptidase